MPSSPTDQAPDVPTNDELGAALEEIGDLLELSGAVIYKSVAYRRAADVVAHSPLPVAARYRAGDPPVLEGVGATISDTLAELSTTGRSAILERLRADIPSGVRDLLAIPGVGPRTARLVHEEFGVASIDDLRSAAQDGRLRTVKGLSERTERSILAGIATLEARSGRLHIDRAEEIVGSVVEELIGARGVAAVTPAGSFRRRRETIGDLDILVETNDPAVALDAFVGMSSVASVLARGDVRASMRRHDGVQVDLMTLPVGRAGTWLIHFTGSKDHNVALRGRARDRGWSLSELGYVRIDADTADERPRTFATEEEAYRFLDLPLIEPELREGRGEVEAAEAGALPDLVRVDDVRGDLHSHSEWSDGSEPIEVMARAARGRGLEYLVLTDHTMSLGVARGLDPARFAEQRGIVRALDELFADEASAGAAAPFRLLHGCEMEIRADGQLDLPDELLATFDIVVASLHVGRSQPRTRLTERVVGAIRSPHVDVIAHPSGRKIDRRPDLDLDWERVYSAAAETGTALEINGSPDRLDLSDERARAAVAAGCLVSIDSDAHRTTELDYQRYGVWQARRGWVSADRVLNARPLDDLLAWVADKPGRIA